MLGKIKGISGLVAMAIGAVALHPGTGSAAAPTKLTTVVAFDGENGAVPLNGNLLYGGQTLYGTTAGGGFLTNPPGPADFGAVFSVPDTVGQSTPTLLHSFSGPDGTRPNGGLVADAAGNLYGTTAAGGAHGLGTVFKLVNPHVASGTWTLTTLHSFAGTPDGASPVTGVSFGPDGSIYGATPAGGSLSAGTIYKVSPAGTYQIVHTFNPDTEGRQPETNVVLDPAGDIVGTLAFSAGTHAHDFGYLFALSPAGVYRYISTVGAGHAVGNIVRDSAGNVYGTSNKVFLPAPLGAAIWRVTAVTHVWSYLAVVEGQTTAGGLTRDAAGNLYATTTGSPDAFTNVRSNGGTVFTVSPSGTVTTLATLGLNNQSPQGGVILDPAGNLWGTTAAGGVDCKSQANLTATGCGTLFALSP